MGMRLMHLFEELNKLGTTVVIATHNAHIVEKMGYPRIHLDEGWLEMVDPEPSPAPETADEGGPSETAEGEPPEDGNTGTLPDFEKLI